MTLPTARKVTEVAVAVLVREDRAVLLADRPPGKPYAGYWEFPGGKVEPGETIAAALTRELREELGIEVATSTPWVTFEFDYPHAYVRLHFERVFDWQGTPHAREGQHFTFYQLRDAAPTPLLPAAVPALRWLQLPDQLILTGRDSSIGRVLAADELREAHARPAGEWIGTYAESRADIERAAKLQCDFALVGPVHNHEHRKDQPALGWSGFAQLGRATPLPLYAYGGVSSADVVRARQQGAHGIAISVPAA